MNEIPQNEITPALMIQRANNVANVCREIVKKRAITIAGKKYVRIEEWQTIATAHGCVLSARDVEVTDNGFRAIGEVRRIDNGAVIATAEGYVGRDEETWKNRDEYACRAMCQTRAMSRAGRSAFAHVVVMIDDKLSTTPFEEVAKEGFGNEKPKDIQEVSVPLNFEKYGDAKWRDHKVHWGTEKLKIKDKTLGEIASTDVKAFHFLREVWKPKPYQGTISGADMNLREALDVAHSEYIEQKEMNQEHDAHE